MLGPVMSLVRPTGVLLLDFFLLFMFCACLSSTVLSVPYSLVISHWEMADLLAILCVMFSLSHMVSRVRCGI